MCEADLDLACHQDSTASRDRSMSMGLGMGEPRRMIGERVPMKQFDLLLGGSHDGKRGRNEGEREVAYQSCLGRLST